MKQDMMTILDLGSSENTRLVRDIREMGAYSGIYPRDITVEELKVLPNVKGIITNGGPSNIVDGTATDVLLEIHGAGYPAMAAGHGPATCERPIGSWDENGGQVLRFLVFDTCGAQPNWNMKSSISDQMELIRQQMGNRKVLLVFSGGTDSSVVAALLIKTIGKQFTCICVDHSLMKEGESESVIEVFRDQMEADLVYVDTTERLLGKLDGVADPERRCEVIGAEFIHVFEEKARKPEGVDFLAQGTIYPDTMRGGTKTTKVVRSHHNVDGLLEDLDFILAGPLHQLFKDEVRACGLELGLPYAMVHCQPFPGPGLDVRCLRAITKEHPEAVRKSDTTPREEFVNTGLDKKVWQCFTIVPNFKPVSVRNDARCLDYPVIIRTVNTVDAMTASIEQIDYEVLQKTTDRILSEVKNVN